MNKVILFYLIDINMMLAIQRQKKLLKTRLIVRLLLVVKFKMTYSKMKLREVTKFMQIIMILIINLEEKLKIKDIVNKSLLILLNLTLKNYSMKRIS